MGGATEEEGVAQEEDALGSAGGLLERVQLTLVFLLFYSVAHFAFCCFFFLDLDKPAAFRFLINFLHVVCVVTS